MPARCVQFDGNIVDFFTRVRSSALRKLDLDDAGPLDDRDQLAILDEAVPHILITKGIKCDDEVVITGLRDVFGTPAIHIAIFGCDQHNRKLITSNSLRRRSLRERKWLIPPPYLLEALSVADPDPPALDPEQLPLMLTASLCASAAGAAQNVA